MTVLKTEGDREIYEIYYFLRPVPYHPSNLFCSKEIRPRLSEGTPLLCYDQNELKEKITSLLNPFSPCPHYPHSTLLTKWSPYFFFDLFVEARVKRMSSRDLVRTQRTTSGRSRPIPTKSLHQKSRRWREGELSFLVSLGLGALNLSV